MARIRSIKPEYWSSGQVMDCSRDARLLFIGLWNFCDDRGHFPCSGKQIKALVFPGDDDLNSTTVRELIDELAENGLLTVYSVEGKEYVEIIGWHHQKIDKPQAAKYPAPAFADHSTTIQEQVSTEGRGSDRIGSDDASHCARMTESELRTAIATAYRQAGSIVAPDTGHAAVWLAQGRDPAICLATVRAIVPKKPNVPLKYFDGAIADAHAVPRGTAKSTGPPRSGKRDSYLKAAEELIRGNHERTHDATIIDGSFTAS